MKKLIYFLLTVSVFSACNKPSQPKPPLYTMAQFMDIVQINGGAFSPDETKIIINSKETGIFNAVEIDIATGKQTALTTSTDNAVFSQSYFPTDNRIVYTSDKGGNEIDHIYIKNLDGSTVDLISDTTAKADFAGWSYDRKKMYYTSNGRDKKYFDLFRVDISAGKEGQLYPSTQVYKNEKGLNVSAISSDDRYMALSESITTNNSNMYLLDTQTGKVKMISDHQGDVQFNPQYFSLDGKQLIYLTDEGSEFAYLATYDIATGEKKKTEEAKWDIMYSYLS